MFGISNGLDRPGDSGTPAAEVANCRCKEIHRPRWDIDGGFAKRDNFTGETRVSDSPKGYEDFKKKYWSDENIQYMKHVSDMDKMTDAKYRKFKALEEKSPLWKKPIEKSGKSGTMKYEIQFFANRGIAKQNDKQLKKSIDSWTANIKKHEDKVNNPAKYDKDWDYKDEQQRSGLINH